MICFCRPSVRSLLVCFDANSKATFDGGTDLEVNDLTHDVATVVN